MGMLNSFKFKTYVVEKLWFQNYQCKNVFVWVFFLNHTPEVILKAILQLLFLFGHARHII